MHHGYVIFAIFIIFVTYTATFENSTGRQVWTGDCSNRCLPPRDDTYVVPRQHCSRDESPVRIQIEPADCICETCPCAVIEDYVIPATRVCIRQADTVSQYFSGHTDILQKFYGWMSENTTSRRLAQPVDDTKTSIYSESIGEFKIVDNPCFDGKQKAICVDRNWQQSVNPSVSGVTKIGSEVVEKIPDVAGDQPKSQPEKLITPTKLRSSESCSNLTKKIEEDETLDPASNCSKCVEQGKTCISGCPSAEKNKKKLEK